jgi:hypothetical protein
MSLYMYIFDLCRALNFIKLPASRVTMENIHHDEYVIMRESCLIDRLHPCGDQLFCPCYLFLERAARVCYRRTVGKQLPGQEANVAPRIKDRLL